jgi:uncharacterized DUF497 family protein
LYWACEKDFELDGAVYAFVRRPNENDYLDVLDTDVDPEAVPGVRIIYPFYPSARMTAQAGLFTIHQHPWRDLTRVRPEDFKDGPFELDRIVKWTIPSGSKPAIMQELEKLGVTSATLLPDLDGLARGLWRTAVLRGGVDKDHAVATRLRQQAEADAVRVTVHTHQEMVEEGVSLEEVREVLLDAAVVENYREHKRGPRCLVCRETTRGRHLHVLCTTSLEVVVVITVYEPKPPKWVTPFKRGEQK